MSIDLVQQIKSTLDARGEDLSGPCGAFKITKRVAWSLREQGFQLLLKPSGNNCDGYSVDYVVDTNGQGYDILGDAGGANIPGWEKGDLFPISRMAPPVDPVDPKPVPDQPKPIVSDEYKQIVLQLDALRVQADANTEKIQTQIDQVVKNAEASMKAALAATGGLSGLLGMFKK